MSTTKICPACGHEKPFEMFNRDKTKRLGISSSCKQCAAERSANWHNSNRDRANSASKARYLSDREFQLQYRKDWRAKNRSRAAAMVKAWNKRNPERKKELNRRYKSRNPHKSTQDQANRKARMLRATPSWANQEKIGEIYLAAKQMTEQTGQKWHVDHVVPLRSKTVCGLHCEANLQLLIAEDNIRKSNKTWPDMPG